MLATMFLKFEDPAIDGSSTAQGHQGEIEVLSWSHGFDQSSGPTRSAVGSGTMEQANHQHFSFTKYLDSATSQILKLSWSGRQIGKATLTCFRSDSPSGLHPVKYLTVTLEHVVIFNYSVSSGPGDTPVENISLDYGIVQYTYTPQKGADGSSATHNLENRTIS